MILGQLEFRSELQHKFLGYDLITEYELSKLKGGAYQALPMLL